MNLARVPTPAAFGLVAWEFMRRFLSPFLSTFCLVALVGGLAACKKAGSTDLGDSGTSNSDASTLSDAGTSNNDASMSTDAGTLNNDASISMDGGIADLGVDSSLDSGPEIPPSVAATYLKASDAFVGQHFGTAIAYSRDGNTLVVGAPNSGAMIAMGGVAYVFKKASDGSWSQTARFEPSNVSMFRTGMRFGESVGVSGDGTIIAVGGPYENSDSQGIGGDQNGNSTMQSGAVYVFTYASGAWTQTAFIKASNSDSGFKFGTALALTTDGSGLFVGAPGENGGSAGPIGSNPANQTTSNAGAVYQFHYDGGAWHQSGYLKSPLPYDSDAFGTSLAITPDGHYLAVSTPGDGANATGVDGTLTGRPFAFAGAAYVFYDAVGTGWVSQGYFKASNAGDYGRFGSSLAFSDNGDALAVGAIGDSTNSTGINGDESNVLAQASGAVFYFRRTASAWSQEAYIKASNPREAAFFGASVSLSGDGAVLAVGSHHENSNATGWDGNQADTSSYQNGAAYLFSSTTGVWEQTHYIKSEGGEPSEYFGNSILLSSDGTQLVVGCNGDPSSAVGAGGDPLAAPTNADSGSVYVYAAVPR